MTENTVKITDLRLGEPKLYMDCTGDTFDPIWARDGSLYFLGNDGSGWHKRCSNNIFFNRAWGADPFHLQGETINCMSDYGGWAEKGPDGCTWKSSGAIEVDGAFYLVVGRHRYGTHGSDHYLRQTTERTSIIKSTDGGQTWTRSAQENYDNPMFPTGHFGTPYFIHYGQDGDTPDIHNAGRYIYAVSNNGFWCNGDRYVLGRVERLKLSRLDSTDWSYYTGGDGMLDENWASQPEQAAPIINNPRKCGETGATYIPALERYVLIAWHYPGDPNVDAHESQFIYYESPAPWGPWTQVGEDTTNPYGWYCPRVLSGWQETRGGEVHTVVMTGGDYYEPERYYKLTLVPLEIKTDGQFPALPPAPAPIVIGHDAAGSQNNQVEYHGDWQPVTRERPGYTDCYPAGTVTERRSETQGDSFTVRFNGRRLRWFAGKEKPQGIAVVSIDGGEEVLVDQWTYCHVPQFSRMMFDSGPLRPGPHTFTVRVTGEMNPHASGAAIFHERVEVAK
jgi:hypothetical protein